jgi:hypothetical protein
MVVTEKRERELGAAFCKIVGESLDEGKTGPAFRGEMTYEVLNAEIPCTQEEFDFCMRHFGEAVSRLIEKERRSRLP